MFHCFTPLVLWYCCVNLTFLFCTFVVSSGPRDGSPYRTDHQQCRRHHVRWAFVDADGRIEHQRWERKADSLHGEYLTSRFPNFKKAPFALKLPYLVTFIFQIVERQHSICSCYTRKQSILVFCRSLHAQSNPNLPYRPTEHGFWALWRNCWIVPWAYIHISSAHRMCLGPNLSEEQEFPTQWSLTRRSPQLQDFSPVNFWSEHKCKIEPAVLMKFHG